MDNFHALVQEPGTPAGSPGESAPEQAPSGPLANMLLPIALMIAVFYFLLIRPQRKQEKTRQAMLSAIKKNDHVLTTGGIYGVVDKVRETDVILKIDERSDVKIRVSRTAIVGVEKRSGTGEDSPKEEVKEPAKG